jgi:cyclophilin family peptidyl-prolyl cis-trans isomerase/outer membrane murein-binding lipoprotein Lpp
MVVCGGMNITCKNSIFAFAVLLAVGFSAGGCSLGRGAEVDTPLVNGQDQLGDLKFNEQDIVNKINQLSNGAAVAGEQAAQTPAAQKQVQLENLAAKYNQALIRTNFGDIKVQFFTEDSPLTVNNFLNLAQEGFYNNTKFHRVIKDFMIQGGDPNSKDDDWANDGAGGPGYQFQDEINGHKLVRGSLAMANSGPNTNGSQFFIVTADSTPWLDGKHTNFGYIVDGMDAVDEISNAEVNENDHPLKDVTIEDVQLLNSADTYKLNDEQLQEMRESASSTAATTTQENVQ